VNTAAKEEREWRPEGGGEAVHRTIAGVPLLGSTVDGGRAVPDQMSLREKEGATPDEKAKAEQGHRRRAPLHRASHDYTADPM
jgi:hypothetical protein